MHSQYSVTECLYFLILCVFFLPSYYYPCHLTRYSLLYQLDAPVTSDEKAPTSMLPSTDKVGTPQTTRLQMLAGGRGAAVMFSLGGGRLT